MASLLKEGVHVYSFDGEKIGKVTHFFSAAAESFPHDQPEDPEFSDVAGVVSAAMGRQMESEVADARANMATNAGFIAVGPERAPVNVEGTPQHGLGMELGPSDTKYMEVHHGGHFHHGGESIYVPLTAIHVVEEDGSVVLRYTSSECVARFTQKPPPLDPGPFTMSHDQ
jgi:hypothetical protein